MMMRRVVAVGVLGFFRMLVVVLGEGHLLNARVGVNDPHAWVGGSDLLHPGLFEVDSHRKVNGGLGQFRHLPRLGLVGVGISPRRDQDGDVHQVPSDFLDKVLLGGDADKSLNIRGQCRVTGHEKPEKRSRYTSNAFHDSLLSLGLSKFIAKNRPRPCTAGVDLEQRYLTI